MTSARAEARRRILLVDDVELNRTLTAAVLAGEYYEVDCVASGTDALRATEDLTYDLVLMDLDMPGLDGCAAAERIAARGGDLSIASLSSHAKPDDVARARAAGMQVHLQRPMTPHDLVHAVRRLIEAAPPPAMRTFRPEVQDEITHRLGPTRVRTYLAALLAQCEALQEALHGPREAVRRLAHDLASSAGMLGYEEVSRRCAELSNCATTQETPAATIEALGRAIALLRKQRRVYEAA